MHGLHTLTFDPADFSDADREMAWMRFFSKINPIVPLPTTGFVPRASIWMAERVTFTYAKSHPQYYESEEALGFNLDQRAMVMAWTCSKGIGQYLHDGKIFSVCPGDVLFLDVSKEAYAFMTDAEMYSLIIPHASIGYDPRLHPSHSWFRASSAGAEQFREWLLAIVPTLPNAKRNDAPEVAIEAKAKMRSLLDRAQTPHPRVLSKADQIIDFVDEHIFDPHLSLASLSERFELSKAELYDEVEFPQGLASYMREKRLEYALRSLLFGKVTATRVAELAALCGYTGSALFKEAFVRLYGFAPDAVLGRLSSARLGHESITSEKLWDRWYSPDLSSGAGQESI